MHREFHPEDMHHLRAHAFGAGEPHAHAEDHRPLYALTATLGVLIAGDLLFGALGWRTPFGVSLATVAAILGGARIVYAALEALAGGRIGADIALAQACLAAIVIGEPFVAAEVVFIALVGEVLEALTFARTQKAIGRLLDQAPRTARVRRDGGERMIPAHQVEVGDLVLVAAGERVPVDGPVVAGRSAVDQSALTGEPIPADKGPGDPVFTGTVNQFGTLEVRAERVGHETTLGQVLRLVADARRRKAPLERAADRYARYFLPVVEAVAALTLVAGYLLGWADTWLRAVAVLVVACPCALILATPAAVMASMAWLARHGVLIKGGIALERLAGCDTFAFDKTGTLTLGRPEPASVEALADLETAEVLRLAATAERSSRHPLARVVLRAAADRGIEPDDPTGAEFEALPGAGVSAHWKPEGTAEPIAVLVGNRRLLAERGIELGPRAEAALAGADDRGETPLLVAVGGRVVGLIGARDPVRPEAHDVVHDLKHLGISEVAILTGDRPNAALAVARRVHIKEVEAELMPAEKAAWIEARQASGRRVAMVGDGINDAPALARAHAGIALGGIGADLAAEAGDLVILGDPLRVLPDLVGLSRATVRVIRQNIIIFAFGLNATAMAAAALGILGPIAAALLHQAGSLLVLLNAMRLLVYGEWSETPPGRAWRAAGRVVRRIDDRLAPAPAIGWLLGRWRPLVASGLGLALIAYATRGWTAIEPNEVGLVRRGGLYVGRLGPGLHLRWPPPLERVDRVRPDRVRSVEVGFRTGGAEPADSGEPVRWESSHDRAVVARFDAESLAMTGDGQLVELSATAQYRLDPRPGALERYAFGVADADEALRPLAESAIRSVVARQRLDDLLTDRRAAEAEAAATLRDRSDAYGLGLIVVGVAFRDVHPPLAVVDAYRDVSRAESERLRRANEGEAYRAEQLALAEGRAAATLSSAEADRASRLSRAGGQADAFLARQDARSTAPTLTDHRLYWELIASTLAGRAKLILDPGQANRRHIVLPDVPLDALATASTLLRAATDPGAAEKTPPSSGSIP